MYLAGSNEQSTVFVYEIKTLCGGLFFLFFICDGFSSFLPLILFDPLGKLKSSGSVVINTVVLKVVSHKNSYI